MVYNPPATGHVVIILDNGTTAMTGLQEHPGTGRRLNHETTGKLDFEGLARAIGIRNISVFDPILDFNGIARVISEALAKDELSLVIARRPCLLAAGAIKARTKEENKDAS
jgi:indolepyruvate ferredoxin oxidoreductase alpha subunit